MYRGRERAQGLLVNARKGGDDANLEQVTGLDHAQASVEPGAMGCYCRS
jgi:hypothetical protein